MINPLYSLSPVCYSRDVYIYGIHADACWTFCKLSSYGVRVCGFVTDEARFAGDTIMNIPVLFHQDNRLDEKTLLIVERGIELNKDTRAAGCSVVNAESVFTREVNPQLRNRPVFLPKGSCENSELVRRVTESDAQIVGCYDLDESGELRLQDFQGIAYKTGDDSKRYAYILPIPTTQSGGQYADRLCRMGCEVYCEDILPESDCKNNTFVLSLDMALKKKKKVFLCCSAGNYADFMNRLLQMYRIETAGIVYDEHDGRSSDIYDLCYEQMDHTAVILFEPYQKRRWEILKNLFCIGFTNEDFSIIGLQECTESRDWLCSNIFFVQDMLTEATIKYVNEPLTGWKVLKKKKAVPDREIRIVILGGSTSAYNIYSVETWGEKLYKKLLQHKISATVYIGARPGEGVVHECLRLLRDAYAIRPDIVISMSGINDTASWRRKQRFNLDSRYKKYQNAAEQICTGLDAEEGYFDFWIRIQKMMEWNAISVNAEYVSVLQPMNIFMPEMSLWEKLQFEKTAYTDGARDFLTHADRRQCCHNLLSRFHHKDKMFVDFCHYSDAGHSLLADDIFDIIKPLIDRRLTPL